ncbi:PAS domain S-box-containing protein [Parvibaculum indicum]|uniref:PAS domain-containing sensor histidine kinase n=1 Tax=Parvibaculum indicum TaxID=562969 RepID=UPI00142239E5|nr:PAS domain-containing sensor histidine kinase [Parvibaculum indicum]NIJ41787.1 PAS domain S-box-containing protein [Parvibaculum indicum]
MHPSKAPETGALTEETERPAAVAADAAAPTPAPLRAAVRPSAPLFRALIENASDIFSIILPDGTIRYLSPAASGAFGFPAEGAVGRSIFNMVHREDRGQMFDDLQSCVRCPGETVRTRARLRSADGSWRVMETRAQNHIDDPEIGGILCISRDVTESEEMASLLREAEELARFGHWRWVKGNPSPSWSPGVARILGRSVSGMPKNGDWYEQLVHPHDRDELLSKFIDAFETHTPIHCVTRFRVSDGTWRHIKIHAYSEVDAHDEIGALVGLAEDVTEEVQADEALRASEARYRLLTEEASDVVAQYALDGTVLYISPSVQSLFGYPAENYIGSPFAMQQVHPDDMQWMRPVFLELEHNRDMVRFEYRAKHANGEYIWVETTMRATRNLDEDGKRVEIIGVTRDINARKAYEAELKEARERAETASRTKSRFLANMSHELRTPLNAIIGFSEILNLQMFGELGHERYKEYAQLINESGQLLLDLISDILDMSKIEAGKYELHPEEGDMRQIAEATLRLVRARADENRQKLDLVVPGPRPLPIVADIRAVKQILLNLLSNAVKFTPPGGVISVGIAEKDEGYILTVSDTGPGIPESQIARLGRPFEQISGNASIAQQGTGLGLALVRSLATMHGGSFGIESELGRGTCVTVALPAVPYCALDRETEADAALQAQAG